MEGLATPTGSAELPKKSADVGVNLGDASDSSSLASEWTPYKD